MQVENTRELSNKTEHGPANLRYTRHKEIIYLVWMSDMTAVTKASAPCLTDHSISIIDVTEPVPRTLQRTRTKSTTQLGKVDGDNSRAAASTFLA